MLVTLAGSPSQSKPVGFAGFPLLSLTRHLPPARGKSFLKVGALGSPRKLHLFAKASPFGRGGCDQREQTERASLLRTNAAVHDLAQDRIMQKAF